MVKAAAAAAAIVRGEIVAYPTETFYGLAVDALDEGALARLCVLKGREAEKAFPLLVAGREMLASLCSEIPPLAERLMAQYWPGPLTLALPARPGLPASIVADGCVAVRVSPRHPAQPAKSLPISPRRSARSSTAAQPPAVGPAPWPACAAIAWRSCARGRWFWRTSSEHWCGSNPTFRSRSRSQPAGGRDTQRS
jgi:L-threonylcarbamoyladenylate synthase